MFFFLYLFKPRLFSKCMHWSREEWNFFPSFKHCNANSAPFFPLQCDVLSIYTRGEVYVTTPQHSFYHSNETFKFGRHFRNGEWIQTVRRYCGKPKVSLLCPLYPGKHSVKQNKKFHLPFYHNLTSNGGKMFKCLKALAEHNSSYPKKKKKTTEKYRKKILLHLLCGLLLVFIQGNQQFDYLGLSKFTANQDGT